MALPYQCLAALGHEGILCATRGSCVQTFSATGSLLSSWAHPAQKAQGVTAEKAPENEQETPAADESAPPSKKRRLDEEEGQGAPEASSDAPKPQNGQSNGSGRQNKRAPFAAKVQELPFITLLTSTSDGKYVVALSGHDKTIWVLEHDGAGNLVEQSQRVMPKRPCSITLTEDGTTILCADKFGDVYSLPLVPSSSDSGESAVAAMPTAADLRKVAVSKGANPLTVHSQRNLKALEDQRRHRADPKVPPKEGPAFEHQLLLGHVSMLTAVVVAHSSRSSGTDRPYIITADRDEHIRVSRGVPQAHIVERFCLGHESFINALCVPASRPELLVSGGGDDELFVWDWMAGTLLSKADLRAAVQAVVPGVAKFAVSQLYTYEAPEQQGQESKAAYVVALCERVPAIFNFKVEGDGLNLAQTIPLPGNPLGVAAVQPNPSAPLRLVVGLDVVNTDGVAQPRPSLVAFELNAGTWAESPGSRFEETPSGDASLSREDLDKVLYNVENLRKTEFEDGDEDQAMENAGDGPVVAP